jgi:hypothetical protein
MWKKIGILLLIILIGFGIWYGFKSTTMYDSMIDFYSDEYKAMAKSDYIVQLKAYCILSLNDPIDGLNYTELLAWERKHLIYYGIEFSFERRNMPIDILTPVSIVKSEYGINKVVGNDTAGRCGEFSLLYTGLCIANEIPVRLIVDKSTIKNYSKTGGAGDHMWNQVFDNGRWITIDPTENKIDDPLLYYRDWNKDINKIYAIEGGTVTYVTQDYLP